MPPRRRSQPPKAKNPRWVVYILRCADGTLYTGITTDLARRTGQHNAGTASKYTRVRRPVAVAFRQTVGTHGDALRRELAVKKLSRAAKELLIARFESRRAARRKRPA